MLIKNTRQNRRKRKEKKKMKRIQCLQQPIKNESFAHYDAHNDDAHKLNLFLLLYMLFIEKNFWVLQFFR